jgi:hypothetical protein
VQENLTGDQYIRDVLQPVVVPHFDNHPLVTRPVYMDDNARPHRTSAVTAPMDLAPCPYITFQPRRGKHHAKRDRRCRSANSGCLMTLLDLSPADFRRKQIVLHRKTFNVTLKKKFFCVILFAFASCLTK